MSCTFATTITAVAALGSALFGSSELGDRSGALETALNWWPYQVFLAVVGLVSVRRIMFRLKDREL